MKPVLQYVFIKVRIRYINIARNTAEQAKIHMFPCHLPELTSNRLLKSVDLCFYASEKDEAKAAKGNDRYD